MNIQDEMNDFRKSRQQFMNTTGKLGHQDEMEKVFSTELLVNRVLRLISKNKGKQPGKVLREAMSREQKHGRALAFMTQNTER